MIFVKNWNFIYCLLLLKIRVESMFGDVLEREEAFLDNEK